MKQNLSHLVVCILLALSIVQANSNNARHKRFAGNPFVRGKASRAEKETGCGLKSIDPTEVLMIQSPYYQYGSYPANHECTWKFLGTNGCQPMIDCANFELENSKECSKDYLQLSDGSEATKRYCDKEGPANISTTTTVLLATFKSGVHFSREKGFKCVVSCAPLDTQVATLHNQAPKTTDCKCGVPGNSPQRIVGGTDAPLYRWKWQAALMLRNRKGPFCGGSLINDRFVLTAAHCVITTGLAVAPQAMQVVLNEHDLKANTEKTITVDVIAIVAHPLYNTADQDYDVALIQLSNPVNLTAKEEPKVTPVCLPPRGQMSTFTGELATVTGWGTTTEGGDQPDILQQVDVRVISNEECNKQYEDRITPRMICAGYPEGQKDSCQGDSGGPFVYNITNPSMRYSEIGIVSFGQGCARPGKSGVYSRVTDLNGWIRMTARNAVWCEEL